jgi:hypothetical protein
MCSVLPSINRDFRKWAPLLFRVGGIRKKPFVKEQPGIRAINRTTILMVEDLEETASLPPDGMGACLPVNNRQGLFFIFAYQAQH